MEPLQPNRDFENLHGETCGDKYSPCLAISFAESTRPKTSRVETALSTMYSFDQEKKSWLFGGVGDQAKKYWWYGVAAAAIRQDTTDIQEMEMPEQ
jgi:hypothetical protein